MVQVSSRIFQRWAQISVGAVEVRSENRDELRLVFNARLSPDGNSATATVYNLSADTRAAIDGRQRDLVIQAGYGSTDQNRVYSAEWVEVTHAREGPNWLTRLESRDGRRFGAIRVERSHPEGTSAWDVLNDIASQGGLPVIASNNAEETLRRRRFNCGYVVSDRLKDAIEALDKEVAVEFGYRRGRILATTRDETIPAEIVVLRPDSGLVGTPERHHDPKRRGTALYRVTSLLRSSFGPGERVDVESSSFTGSLKILEVDHVGDTEGGREAWVSKILGQVLS